MKILVINTGSSSLKFDFFDAASGDARADVKKIARGAIEKIGAESSIKIDVFTGVVLEKSVLVKKYRDAVVEAASCIKSICSENSELQIDAIGHRVVHGGEKFRSPTVIDECVLAELEKFNDLAPLHNPIALEAIHAAKKIFGENIPMVAVFDTAFHHSIPTRAATYALPHELTERHHIRRYGFHGIAHEYMLHRFCELTGKSVSETKLITLQLGSGCSVTAIRDGKSVDTSMGFTPLEGLVMATRSGDLDPGLLAYLARKENLSVAELERVLNERSGLLGISGCSRDMRDLLAAEKSDSRAALAIEVFCYRIKKYLGAYLAALNGADAIVFGGGTGENQPEIRARICEEMDWCGLNLDTNANAKVRGIEQNISASDSRIQAWVIPVDESISIARATAEVIHHSDEEKRETTDGHR